MCWRSYLIVFALSLLPTFEGRYAIITARLLGLDPWISFGVVFAGVSVLGIVLPRVLPLIDRIAEYLRERGVPVVSTIAGAYLEYAEGARRRARRLVNRYGLIGLILFVAIPLPATGVWTGAIAAHLLGMDRRRMTLGLLTGGWVSIVLMGTLSWSLF